MLLPASSFSGSSVVEAIQRAFLFESCVKKVKLSLLLWRQDPYWISSWRLAHDWSTKKLKKSFLPPLSSTYMLLMLRRREELSVKRKNARSKFAMCEWDPLRLRLLRRLLIECILYSERVREREVPLLIFIEGQSVVSQRNRIYTRLLYSGSSSTGRTAVAGRSP